MRRTVSLLAAAAFSAGAITLGVLPASAADATAPPVSSIDIVIGPGLQKQADDYGAREFGYLSEDLKKSVTGALNRSGRLAPDGGKLELVISDAKPSRPTFAQLGRKAGLSMMSRSLGGATITGRLVTPNGDIPINYRWYESDLRNQFATTTWSDAEQAFDMFAGRLARGELPNRPATR